MAATLPINLPKLPCDSCQWYLNYANLDRAGTVCGECGRKLDDLRALQTIQQDFKLYCDLDGVLADFVPQWVKYYQLDPTEYRIRFGNEQFNKQLDAASYQFWNEMPWTPEGPEIWTYVQACNPTLLSAPANSAASRQGKIDWIKRHLGFDQPYIFRKAQHKQQFSNPKAILIDDYDKNVSQWQDRGGFAILHRGNAIETIDRLLEFGVQQYYKNNEH